MKSTSETRPALDLAVRAETSACGPWRVYGLVALVALLAHGLSLCATHLWVYPDSIDYIELAGGIVDRGDWDDELFLIRPPGYPVMLAVVFKLFGPASAIAIQLLQHGLGACTALLTAAIAWQLTSRKGPALLAGILCATSLQVLAYCNLVLSEITFTAALTAGVYFLVRYSQRGGWRTLAAASIAGGIGYLIKPVGTYFFGVCALAVLLRVWNESKTAVGSKGSEATMGTAVHARSQALRFARGLVKGMFVAAFPALLVAAPWLLEGALKHTSMGTARTLDYVYYLRAVTIDDLDSARSEAMRDVHAVVAEAVVRGLLSPDADYHDRRTVIQAYKAVRGLSFAESTATLGRAGRDLIREHPQSIAVNTVNYAAWLLLAPDPAYRFVPGGSPGADGGRDKSADLYDIATYSRGAGSWEATLRRHRHHLPLAWSPRTITPWWNAMKAAFFKRVDRGSPLLGWRDTLFEEFILLCLVGGVGTLFTRKRAMWGIVFATLLLQVLISAFLSGPQTRYLVPVKPILCIWAAVAVASVFHVLCAGVRLVVERLCRSTSPAHPLVSG